MSEHTGAYSMSAEDTDPARLSEQNVQVTQADRLMAHDAYAQSGLFLEAERAEKGLLDDGWYVQAFARHRARAEPDLVEAAKRVLEWWPEGSEEHSLAGKSKGGTFAADIQALRAAVTRADV